MCGIFALLNSSLDDEMETMTKEQFYKCKGRGPEYSSFNTYHKLILGFHRLAINGLNDDSNQPIIYNNITLICNGEIYNYEKLYKYMNVIPITNSDCEVIIHLYLKYGIEQTLTMLDGVFAFILYDNRITKENTSNKVYVARDPIGVRPLYYMRPLNDRHIFSHDSDTENENQNNNEPLYGFASEMKCLETYYNDTTQTNKKYTLTHFEPGTYSMFKLTEQGLDVWYPIMKNKSYYMPTFPHEHFLNFTNKPQLDKLKEDYYINIARYLKLAVDKRCITSDRPIACLLSGGLDSSLIAALVADYFKKNKQQQIETYSIGLENSEDIKHARIVAEYIGSKHNEIIVSERQMFYIIPELIQTIESYDTTTVRASIGNYLIGKYIASNSDAKVIFNGDGSDELFGGYLYINKCPDDIEFDKEVRRLLKDIHLFDVLRSDKCISSNGLEPRTPFLDRNFVNYVLSIPPYFRNHNNFDEPEKYLLRRSFDKEHFQNSQNQPLLPDKILWRKKEAFSDGVSSQEKSLFLILQEMIASKYSEETPNIELEKKYYKSLFVKHFPNCQHIVPYLWMPKYTDTNDPSARTLDVYNSSKVKMYC
jgi:asparagine synthase (glutamine-hydrolysing)